MLVERKECGEGLRIDLEPRNALVFSYFPPNGSTNPDVFSLKPSASLRESSLKISVHQV